MGINRACIKFLTLGISDWSAPPPNIRYTEFCQLYPPKPSLKIIGKWKNLMKGIVVMLRFVGCWGINKGSASALAQGNGIVLDLYASKFQLECISLADILFTAELLWPGPGRRMTRVIVWKMNSIGRDEPTNLRPGWIVQLSTSEESEDAAAGHLENLSFKKAFWTILGICYWRPWKPSCHFEHSLSINHSEQF